MHKTHCPAGTKVKIFNKFRSFISLSKIMWHGDTFSRRNMSTKKSKGGSVEFKKGAQAIQEGLHKKRGQEPAPNDEGCT